MAGETFVQRFLGVQGRARRRLWLLDSLEHLEPQACADWLCTLLDSPDRAVLVATSRRALGVDGEQEVVVPPLPVPAEDADPAAVAASPAVALFVQCARALRPGFQVGPRNHRELGQLCRALDGLPLALELAAGRCRAHSVAEICQALARPFELLQRDRVRAGTAGRQDSMHNAIDWSWRLLGPAEPDFVIALTVLRGAWAAADAAALTGSAEPRGVLDALLAQSLLRSESGSGGALRFRLPELVRAFAASRRDAALGARLRSRHRARCLQLVSELPAGATPAEADLPNLFQALRRAPLDSAEVEALALMLALRGHWEQRGVATELLAALTALVGPPTVDTPGLAAPACALLSMLQFDFGDPDDARTLAGRGLDAADDAAARAAALCALARVGDGREGPEAGPRAGSAAGQGAGGGAQLEAVAGSTAAGPVLQAQALVLLARRATRAGDLALARRQLAQARRHFKAAGAVRQALGLRLDWVLWLRAKGRPGAALELAEAGEAEAAATGERVVRLRALELQALLLSDQRRWSDALAALQRCLGAARPLHARRRLLRALWLLPLCLARLRLPLPAARLLGFAERWRAGPAGRLGTADRRLAGRVRRRVRAQIGRGPAQAARVEGAAWTLSQAVQATQEHADPRDPGGETG